MTFIDIHCETRTIYILKLDIDFFSIFVKKIVVLNSLNVVIITSKNYPTANSVNNINSAF